MRERGSKLVDEPTVARAGASLPVRERGSKPQHPDHGARLAAQYRQRFGELPSDTLERARAALAGECVSATAVARRGPPILILPIVCGESTPRREDREFAEGLAEQMAVALSRICIGPVRLVRAGERVAVDAGVVSYALAGRVMRTGDRLRVLLRLFDMASDAHLWGDAFDGTQADGLALQDRVVAAASAIHARVEDATTDEAWQQPPESLTARDLIVRALGRIRAGDPYNNESALEMALAATELDPTDAAAAALVGACHARRVSFGHSRDWLGDSAAALHFSARAAALDSSDPIALVARSVVAQQADDRTGTEILTARALAISPGSAWGWERRGYFHVVSGNFAQGIGDLRRSIALSGPRASMVGCLNGVAQAQLWQGRAQPARYLAK